MAILLAITLDGAAALTPEVGASGCSLLPRRSSPGPLPRVTTVVLVGDTGFAPDKAPVRADGVNKHGRMLSFAEATEAIAGEIGGDINFANLETVVTDRNDLRPSTKSFNFRTHPDGIAQLVERGFNLFSLANNHALDYGSAGAGETLRHMAGLPREKVKGYAGLGRTVAEAAAPACFEVNGLGFAFAAMGIGGGGFDRSGGAGQLSIHSAAAVASVLDGLAATGADFRILSLHYGVELEERPSPGQVRTWRQKLSRDGRVDLIIGHHSHVPQGIELTDGRLIFYGLGNFLHHGLRDMTSLGICHDWGMLAKVHLVTSTTGRPQVAAVEIVPLEAMHVETRRMSAPAARRRIAALNGLARQLDDASTGARGLRFVPLADGSGLYCAPGSEGLPAPLAELCRAYRDVAPDGEAGVVAAFETASCGVGEPPTGLVGIRQRRVGRAPAGTKGADRRATTTKAAEARDGVDAKPLFRQQER